MVATMKRVRVPSVVSTALTTEEVADWTEGFISWAEASGNKKLGKMFASNTVRESCPSGCAFKDICYGEHFRTRIAWDRIKEHGKSWEEFLYAVKRIPRGALWRHNVVGDLPQRSGTINRQMMRGLVAANKGRRGFTYTHHVLTPANIKTLQDVNAGGLTVNVSCETEAQVDKARALGLPAVIVRSRATGYQKNETTPDGHPIRQCPAEISDMTCAECGICARPLRLTVVGFTAHGGGAKRVEAVLFKIRAAEAAATKGE